MKKSRLLLSALILLATGLQVPGQVPFYPRPKIDNDKVFNKHAPISQMGKTNRRGNGGHPTVDFSSSRGISPSGFFSESRSLPRSASSYLHANNNPAVFSDERIATSRFHLAKDINTSTPGSYPGNDNIYDDAPVFPQLNGVVYFSADDGIHGMELWRSDGTSGGTNLVADVLPGIASSDPRSITLALGKLFFSAYTDPQGGWEPWVSDGTAAGTTRLIGIDASINHDTPEGFAVVQDKIYIITNSFIPPQSTLFITDGTPGGTSLLYDFVSNGYGRGLITDPVAANGLLFFVASLPAYGDTFWRSDGTPSGTFMVKDFGSDESEFYSPLQMTSYNNKLYFSGDDGDGDGRRLWYSDGTLEGTSKAFNPGNVYFPERVGVRRNEPLAVLNGVLYFSGFTDTDGGGLYKFDASNNDGVTLVKDLTTEPEIDFIAGEEFKATNNSIYFKVISFTLGVHEQLWVSNGTESSTQLIETFEVGESAFNFYGINGKLFFTEFDPANGLEPWTSDGTPGGTSRLKDIFKGTASSMFSTPTFFTFYNGKVLFDADNGTLGPELWITDGTEAGTLPVKDINNSTTVGSEAGLSIKGIVSNGKSVLFGAYEPEHGNELYKSNGTEAGTMLINDIVPGNDGSYPYMFRHKNDFDYFAVETPTQIIIYKSDGTGQVLQQVSGALYWDPYFLEGFQVTDHGITLYIFRNRYSGFMELWRSDGTESGTYSLSTNLTLNYGDYIVMVGDKGFFTADDGTNGPQLWITDGTVPGTKIVKNINPGGSGAYPYSLFVYKNEVYFGAYDGTSPYYSFWKSNGTEAGTVKIKDITPAFWDYHSNLFAQYDLQYFCISGDELFFSAADFNNNPNNGAELWKTNGLPLYTTQVKNINPFAGSGPTNLVDVDGTLYFMANDGTHGMEPWLSNGKENGTKLVADVTPGNVGSVVDNLVSAGGKLFFVKDNGENPALWSAEGVGKASRVLDPGLNNLQYIQALTTVGNQLFFSARSPKFGDELFVGFVDKTRRNDPFFRVVGESGVANKKNLKFGATLYPNPSDGPVSLLLSGPASSALVSITGAEGQVLWQKKVNGNSTTRLPAEKLSSGVYMVLIKSGEEQKILKLVRP